MFVGIDEQSNNAVKELYDAFATGNNEPKEYYY
jgi:hypothetical protein